MKLKIILGLLWLVAMNSYAANYSKKEDEYIGLYQSSEKVPYEQENGTVYRNVQQTILIKRINKNGSLSIDINTLSANGNSCSYSGIGRWYHSKDRFEFSNASELDDDVDYVCKVAVIIKNRSAYVITQTSGCKINCGIRNSLDGWIIRKYP